MPARAPPASATTASAGCWLARPASKKCCASRARAEVGAFAYTALDTRGRERKGVLEGDTPRQVRQQLREQGLTPLEVMAAAEKEGKITRRFSFQRGISSTDLALITR